MSFQQIAKLCGVRGSIFTKVMKDMPENELDEVNEIIIKLVKDPILRNCKIEFCAALRRTISNEYSDPELGETDYMIALVKATLMAKIDPEKDLNKILEDPAQKKKWYQTYIFNYLKQILLENKIPAYDEKTKINISNEVTEELSNSLSSHNISHIVINNSIFIKDGVVDPIIAEIKQKYLNDQVKISMIDGKIVVNANRILKERESIKEHSLNNEESGEQVEARLKGKIIVDNNETILKLKERLPSYAHPVLTIYLEDERPDEFINQYGPGKPRVIHISKFLGMSIKEVKRILYLIKIHFMILQLGY